MSNDASVLVSGASGPMRFPVPGYAVVHERGTLIFDTGLHDTLMSSNEELGGLARVFTVELTPDDMVEERLAERGLDVAAVTHVVNSHLHFDHCGRNGPFAQATTLVQRAEWEAAHDRGPSTYVGVPLDEVGAGHLQLIDGAHDVFGDGTVVIKSTPGHTPGHNVLFLKLKKTGPIVLSGDLYHYPEERTLNRLPISEFNKEQTAASRAELEVFLKKTGAQLWIEHDIVGNAKLKKAPAYYD